jgi:hypothetical protein
LGLRWRDGSLRLWCEMRADVVERRQAVVVRLAGLRGEGRLVGRGGASGVDPRGTSADCVAVGRGGRICAGGAGPVAVDTGGGRGVLPSWWPSDAGVADVARAGRRGSVASGLLSDGAAGSVGS